MIYTDGIHLIADDVDELHHFAARIGLKRCWFHGVRKKHPHYDLGAKPGAFRDFMKEKAIGFGAKEVTSRDIVKHFQNK